MKETSQMKETIQFEMLSQLIAKNNATRELCRQEIERLDRNIRESDKILGYDTPRFFSTYFNV